MSDFIRLKNFPSRLLAEQAIDLLAQQGIVAFIQGEDAGIGGLVEGGWAQGVNLWVASDRVEEAREIMTGFFDGV